VAQLPAPVVLSGRHVRLEPLGVEHIDDLTRSTAGDEELWRWMPAFPEDSAAMAGVVDRALADRAAGTRFPFAILNARTGTALGSSSYLDIDPANHRIEIGWTWLARSAWRTPVNTEAKLLLLGNAFDALGYERVALKTHHRNQRSQEAIARLGAVREGTLRHHMLHYDGTWRDSVYFSILSAEWPDVRARLAARLG
jgi:N-acetyltransferase